LALSKLLLTVIKSRISSLRPERNIITCDYHPHQNLVAQTTAENMSKPPRVLLG
jgi:hypothetical protein